MKLKNFLIIAILVIITLIGVTIFNKYKNNEREDVKIPVLLYHDFVNTLPFKMDIQ